MKVRIGPYKKDDKKRKVEIKLDPYDTWSMDHTLALIVLPMLKQLKATKHGSPMVDDEDVPDHLRTQSYHDYDVQMCFDWYLENPPDGHDDLIHTKWDWVMDEMIWAFKQVIKDDDSKFYEYIDNLKGKNVIERAMNMKVDREGLKQYHDRIDNGLRLFGKYYQGLWD